MTLCSDAISVRRDNESAIESCARQAVARSSKGPRAPSEATDAALAYMKASRADVAFFIFMLDAGGHKSETISVINELPTGACGGWTRPTRAHRLTLR
jgi:hypothetical protein